MRTSRRARSRRRITATSRGGDYNVIATSHDFDINSVTLPGEFTFSLSLDAVGASNVTVSY